MHAPWSAPAIECETITLKHASGYPQGINTKYSLFPCHLETNCFTGISVVNTVHCNEFLLSSKLNRSPTVQDTQAACLIHRIEMTVRVRRFETLGSTR
jgi:hypothetical protein